jgi:hypothetical protein
VANQRLHSNCNPRNHSHTVGKKGQLLARSLAAGLAFQAPLWCGKHRKVYQQAKLHKHYRITQAKLPI